MEKKFERRDYFNLKRQYAGFHFMLVIIRVLFAVTMLVLIVVSSLYAVNPLLDPNFVKTVKYVADVLLPVTVVCWIVIKLINVSYLRKLRYYKRKLDILDEIQEGNFDYNSPTIQALANILLVVDLEVEDGDYVLQS